MKKFKFALSFTAGVLVTVLILQNTDVVSIRFLFWEMTMSRIILLPFLIFCGFIAGYLTGKKF